MRTTNLMNLHYDDFLECLVYKNNKIYFGTGKIEITCMKSKYGNNDEYDFIGNDGIWTNQVPIKRLGVELFEYYCELVRSGYQ